LRNRAPGENNGKNIMKYVENRLYPPRFHSRYAILTALRKSLQSVNERYLKKYSSDAVLVDLGCGEMPYQPLFQGKVSRYVGVDIEGNEAADFYFDKDGKSPLKEEFADIVLSTQVLEHVPKPSLYLRECLRIVKPRGLLILSTHGCWPYHADPHDFWRWTCEGLYRDVEEAGFEVVHFDGVIGLGALSLQFLQDALLPRIPSFMKYIKYCFAVFFQGLIQLFDRLSSSEERRKNAWVFVLVALKRSTSQYDQKKRLPEPEGS
jgi:SAM-dependent methyltransferase